MTLDEFLRWLHLFSAAVWVGGLLTLVLVMPVARRSGSTGREIRAISHAYGRAAWPAVFLGIASGITMVLRQDLDWLHDQKLLTKTGLSVLAVVLLSWHQTRSPSSAQVTKGAIRLLLLLVGIALFSIAILA
jgi:putative copper export protein